MKTHGLLFLAGLWVCSGCYKDDVDIAALNNNPFDPQYTGAPVFTVEGTELVFIDAGSASYYVQDIHIRVHEELFLAPAAYSVAVQDLESGLGSEATPAAEPGAWLYRRPPAIGEEVCIELRLMNSTSTARVETYCVTLE